MKFSLFEDVSKYFYNPYNPHNNCNFKFDKTSNTLSCPQCNTPIPIKNNIINILHIAQLDDQKKRELEGNTIELTPENIKLYLNKSNWSSYYSYICHKKINILVSYIKGVPQDALKHIAFLGCGTGFEIGLLLQKGLPFKNIYASDLSISALSIVPYQFEKTNLDFELTLFTSDLDFCPIKDPSFTIIIYEAMHHTPDMHQTMERLLAFGYQNIFIVEPANNFLIRYLSKRGMAQRIEYSGIKPGRLDIRKAETLAKKYNYSLTRKSVWELPEDYFNKLKNKNKFITMNTLTPLIELLSIVGNQFSFGNMVICHFERRGK